MRLLALGPNRMVKLDAAATKGEEPPMDGRFVPQGRIFRTTRRAAGKREIVIQYLEEPYQTVAEAMPERKIDDQAAPSNPSLRFRRSRGRRPRLAAQQSRLKHKGDLRMLPPGSFSDYLGMLNVRQPEQQKITLKMFSRDSCFTC